MNTDVLLKRIISYAYNEVNYYRELFDTNFINLNSIQSVTDLFRLPVLTKEIVQTESLRMISNEYKKFPKNQFIQIKRTSGSTGEYLKIYWDSKNDIRSMFPVWRIRKNFYSIEPKMKYCDFYTVNYKRNKIITPNIKEISFDGRILSFCKINLTYERLKKNYEDILLFNPDWLSLQPSIAYLITQIIKEYNFPIPSNLKYIELNGEILLNEYRQVINETFNIYPINVYGTNETNVIAMEYGDNKLHILNDNVIVEILKDGKSVIGEEGEIYITSLSNYAMPFIRYKTGDIGIIKNSNLGNIIEVKSGRTSDFIILENGKKINSFILFGIIQYTNEYMHNSIKQFQIIQTNINKFDVFIVLKNEYKNWKFAIKNKFIENIIEEELRNAEWNFYFLDNILPDSQTGKIKYFKSFN